MKKNQDALELFPKHILLSKGGRYYFNPLYVSQRLNFFQSLGPSEINILIRKQQLIQPNANK